MIEGNIIPDTFVILQDTTERNFVLTKRWYQLSKTEIDMKISSRLKLEQEKRLEDQL